jgi:hypothetical protein
MKNCVLVRLKTNSMQVGGEVIAEAVLGTGPRQCRGSSEAQLPMGMNRLTVQYPKGTHSEYILFEI